MTLLPVIERELRAESRSAFTYWLRVAGGVSLLVAGLMYLLDHGLGNMSGEALFRWMHIILFAAIWLVALLMTADSISRERREGTLELLFLTPLRPFEVVLAKGLAHGLRAATVMVAAIPVLVVPFLMGGVGWREVVAAVLIDFSVLCWALAAGLFASSFNRTMTRALVWALIGGLCAFVALVHVHGAGLQLVMSSSLAGSASAWRPGAYEIFLRQGWFLMLLPAGVLNSMNRVFPGGVMDAWMWSLAVIALASVVIFGSVVLLAAQGMKRAARNRTKSAARQRVEKELFTPTFGLGFYRLWMRRLLERNPVGWLERRTWQARLVTWSWLAVVISLLSWILGSQAFFRGGFTALNMLLAWALVANVALTAAGSLRRERETGVIELLLVSPLSVPQIVGGRVRSIVGQFLPAAALIFGSWLWLLRAFKGTHVFRGQMSEDLQIVGYFVITLLTLPVVGLYYSLSCRMFFVALFWTAATAIVLPWLAVTGVSEFMILDPSTGMMPRYWDIGLGIVAGAGVFGLLRWRGAGSAGVSVALAGALAVVGALSLKCAFWTDLWDASSQQLKGLLTGAAVQIGIAAGLGARLRRRLETRQFALPQ